MKSTGLIVLGMHRSGTSALTGALHACGAYAGLNSDLTGSNVENPKGFFERRDIRQICDELLYSADADWWKTSAFEIGKVGNIQLKQQRMAFAEIVNVLSKEKVWILKEPRLCLLLPLLLDIIPKPICLLIYRNPIEVAKSLRTRNQISLQQGISLWEKYTLSALDAIHSKPHIRVSYHDLISDPDYTLSNIIKKLSKFGVKGLSNTFELSSFIDKSLHRSLYDPHEMEILTDSQLHLWESLEKEKQLVHLDTHKSPKGQMYVLQDLEQQFLKNNRVAGMIMLACLTLKTVVTD
jgi:hypothetical protein